MLRKIFFGSMDWIWRLGWLNLLWFLFSIPLFTLIPATFAMYAVVNKWLTEDKDIDIFPTFTSAFKKYFIKSVPLGAILLFLGLFLYFDLLILSGETNELMTIVRYGILILAFLFVPVASYSIQVFIEYEVPWYKALAISFFITLRKPLNTLLLVCGILFAVLVFVFFTGFGILFFASLTALFSSKAAIAGIKDLQGFNANNNRINLS